MKMLATLFVAFLSVQVTSACLAQDIQIDSSRRKENRPSLDSAMRADGTLDLAMLWSQGRAIGKGPVWFTHSPMRLADIKGITLYGLMVGKPLRRTAWTRWSVEMRSLPVEFVVRKLTC